MAKADVMKTEREPHCKYSAAMEMGMKINSAMEIIFLIDIGTRMVYARVRSSCLAIAQLILPEIWVKAPSL